MEKRNLSLHAALQKLCSLQMLCKINISFGFSLGKNHFSGFNYHRPCLMSSSFLDFKKTSFI